MVRGDKNPLSEVETPSASGDSEEIDRIMKEIEDLEKKMDTAGTDTETVSSSPEATEVKAQDTQQEEFEEEDEAPQSDKVVPFRTVAQVESMVETDAVPVNDEPLMKETRSMGDGGLALKVGGCTEVSLEFSRAGVVVSLTCTDEALCITTDSGAEFRIPFKRAA